MSKPDSDENIIENYIKENYITPQQIVSLLCLGPAECIFLDLFREDNPGLHFLTAEDIRALSHEYYLTNNNNLQETLKFIQSELKKYCKFVYDVWICFKFTIIEKIPDGSTDHQIIELNITEYLPAQLINLLYYLFDFIFYSTIIRNFPYNTKKAMIQKNVTHIVLLYSKLYKFLQQPDPSLQFFYFNKRNVSLTFLSNVMVYKCFDNIHPISLTIIENYIYFLNEMLQTFIHLLGSTSSETNKQKIDFALGHVAVFLLHLPNLSETLCNDQINPEFISRGLMREFEKRDIFFVRESDEKIGKTFTLIEVAGLKRSGEDMTKFDVRRNIEFNPMSEGTLSNAIQLVSAVRTKLNEKQKSSVSEADLQPIIEYLKIKYTRLKEHGYDYFSFLYFFSTRIEQFTLINSVSKDNKLVLHCDFSACCIQVPNFDIFTTDEEKQVKVIEEKKKMQQQKELEQMKIEEQELVKRSLRLDELKFKKELRTERKENKNKTLLRPQEAQEAAAAAAPIELTAKEKDLLTIQRNSNFKNNVEPIFQQFSDAIQSGDYQTAADMLNAKLPQKLRLHIPWTEANMRKFSPKVKQVYDDLLASVLASRAASSASSASVQDSPAIISPVEAPFSPVEAPSSPVEAPSSPVEAPSSPVEAPFSFPSIAVSDTKKNVKLILFEQYIASLCDGNGIACFTFMFRCTLKQFFRISNFVRKTSDQDIIQMLSTLTPAPFSAASVARPLTEYMKLQGSGQTSRALFGLALLNGICRHEHVRIAFIGRTFIQLLACQSRLPQDKCIELHIPQETSDIDVHVIFNNDIDPMQYRSFVIHIFNLLWDIPETNIHIQWEKKQKPDISEEMLKTISEYRREMETKQLLNASATRAFADAAPPRPQRDMHDNYAWTLFTSFKEGQRMYESISRGSPETVKVFFNNKGVIGEVSDISFKTSGKIVETFKFPGIAAIAPPDLKVNMLHLLELKYKPKSPLFHEPEFHDVYLEFEFPDAQSGLEECLTIIINTFKSFVTNGFDFANRKDFYFIHVSSLLKFIIRAIQYQGIHLFNQKGSNYRVRELYDQLTMNLHRVLESRQDIRDIIDKVDNVALNIIGLFFTQDKNDFNIRAFADTTIYKNSEKNATGAAVRVDMDLHKHILHILSVNGFDSSFLSKTNLFGGIKYSRRHNRDNKQNSNQDTRRRNHHTKKNKKQKIRKTKRRNKNKKIKKIKFTLSKKTNTSLKIKKNRHNK
jgi:hypothetical protein